MGPRAIAFLLALIIGLIAYAIFVPRSSANFSIGSEIKDEEKQKWMRIFGVFSQELYKTMPEGMARNMEKKSNRNVELLIQRSGNPWNIKANEFGFLRFIGTLVGLAGGFLAYLAVAKYVGLPIYVYVGAGGFLGWYMPKSKYTEFAKQRDLDFKRQLPDALDLLIISLSSGTTFGNALRNALPQMKEGVLKDEFREISRALDSGKTLSESLDSFAKKAPNESIMAFIRSLQEATELNVSLVEVLESRAEASRREYFALLQQRTATLESKMMMVLTPTLVPALLITVIAPSASSLVGSIGA